MSNWIEIGTLSDIPVLGSRAPDLRAAAASIRCATLLGFAIFYVSL